MPYARPDLSTLLQQSAQDINSANIGLDGFLPLALLPYLAQQLVGSAWEHYDYQAWIAKMCTPWGAENEFCDGWGNFRGVPRKTATAAILSVAFTGTGSIPVGTSCSLQNGTKYTVGTAGISNNGTIIVTMTANQTGAASNAVVGTQVVLTGVINGVNGASGVVVTTTAGADRETDDDYKSRYLAAYANPAQGGALADYIRWAEEIGGVTRAWIGVNMLGQNTISVYTMFDAARVSASGFPQGGNGVATGETRAAAATGDQLLVANALYPERPATVLVYSCAPNNLPVNFTITGLGSANTAANQAAITAALNDMFLRLGYVGGTTDPDTMEAYSGIEPSSWFDAISSVVGSQTFAVPVPAAPITPGTGQLPTLGVINFSS